MKTRLIIISFFLCILSASSHAQATSVEDVKFHIRDVSGLLKTDTAEDFYVVEYKDKTAAELYTNMLSAVATSYQKPGNVLSKVDNVVITISGKALDVPAPKDLDLINETFPAKNSYYAFDYVLSFQFKDGKIKVNAPTFSAENVLFANPFNNGRYTEVADRFPLVHFNNPEDEITICFEKYINDIIQALLKKSETVNDW